MNMLRVYLRKWSWKLFTTSVASLWPSAICERYRIDKLLFFVSVFSTFEGVRIKYLRFGYKIRIENACSSSGILGRFLMTGKWFFRVISEMLVGLMNLKN